MQNLYLLTAKGILSKNCNIAHQQMYQLQLTPREIYSLTLHHNLQFTINTIRGPICPAEQITREEWEKRPYTVPPTTDIATKEFFDLVHALKQERKKSARRIQTIGCLTLILTSIAFMLLTAHGNALLTLRRGAGVATLLYSTYALARQIAPRQFLQLALLSGWTDATGTLPQAERFQSIQERVNNHAQRMARQEAV